MKHSWRLHLRTVGSVVLIGVLVSACGGGSSVSTRMPRGGPSAGSVAGDPTAFQIDAPATLSFEATGQRTTVTLPTPTTRNGNGEVVVENDAPKDFPLGETTVNWTARDQSGVTASAQQKIALRDTTPPLLTAPADVVATAPSANGIEVDLGTPEVFDALGAVDVSRDGPAQFPIGETAVTWTATDAVGNSATAMQRVSVALASSAVDVKPPVLTAPADVNATSADGQPVAVQLGMPTASDDSGSPTVSNNAPARFPVGLTLVTWNAADAAGNRASATQRVTVVNGAASDKSAPVLALTKATTIGPVEASATLTAVDIGTATAQDAVDGVLTPRNDSPSGGFPVGTTTVTWYATDRAGNTATVLQRITVADRTPPSVTAPADIAQSGFRALNRLTLAAPQARDLVDGTVSVTNDAPTAGFPLGDSTVTWTATDRAGNTARAQQKVTLNAVACSENMPFFRDQVWPQVLAADCLSCHTTDGVTSNFNLVNTTASDFLATNLAAAQRFVIRKDSAGQSLILSKPSNGLNDHGGGRRFAAGDPRFDALVELSDRLSVCIDGNTGAQQGLVLTTPYQHLRRATLALAGRLPTAAEEAGVNGATTPAAFEAAMNSILDAVMTEPAFFNRVKEIYNDLLLTNALADASALNLDLNNFANGSYYSPSRLTAQGYASADINRLRNSVGQGVGFAPVELVAYVVRNNRPFTEILTADYTMVNPYSATLFGVTPEGPAGFNFVYGDAADAKNPTEFRPAVITDENSRRYPHAGVLNTLAFLGRYQSTPTNRNRARARYVFKYFLDTDVEGLANRGGLDLDNVVGQFPTLEDPQCKVCHDVMDPVAGLFKNWDDDGPFLGDVQNWFNTRTPPQMLAPGYTLQSVDALPSTESPRALAWLAGRVAADNRFAVSTVKTVVIALLGSAAAADVALTEDLKAKFVAGGFNFKSLVKSIVATEYFRASNIGAADDPAQFAAHGLERLLTPEQLDRKIRAVTGGYRWRSPAGRTLLQSTTYLLLYGGIDSDEITERTTSPTGMMAAIQDRLAFQISCEVTAADFAKVAAERALFPNVTIDDTPDAASAAIRGNLQYLHRRILGEELALDDPEITRTFDLFVAARNAAGADGLSAACGGGLPAQDPIRLDAQRTVQAWQAVVAYLLSDFRFFME